MYVYIYIPAAAMGPRQEATARWGERQAAGATRLDAAARARTSRAAPLLPRAPAVWEQGGRAGESRFLEVVVLASGWAWVVHARCSFSVGL